MAYTASNAYAGGHLWYNTIAYTGFDAAFSVTIQSTTGSRMAENTEGELLNPTPSQASADFFYEEAALSIYPNPASEQLHLSGVGSEAIQVILYDAMGRNIYQAMLKENDIIDVSKFNRGTYHLLINAEGKTFQRTIILQ